MLPYLKNCVVVIYFLFSVTTATEFVPCTLGLAPKLVEVGGCEKPPCKLVKGTNITWSMEFTADDDHTEITNGFVAIFMGMSQGYPGLDGVVACNNLYSMPDHIKVGCPVKKGKMYRHEVIMEHKFALPRLTLPVKYSLRDKTTDVDFVCSELLVSLN